MARKKKLGKRILDFGAGEGILKNTFYSALIFVVIVILGLFYLSIQGNSSNGDSFLVFLIVPLILFPIFVVSTCIVLFINLFRKDIPPKILITINTLVPMITLYIMLKQY